MTAKARHERARHSHRQQGTGSTVLPDVPCPCAAARPSKPPTLTFVYPRPSKLRARPSVVIPSVARNPSDALLCPHPEHTRGACFWSFCPAFTLSFRAQRGIPQSFLFCSNPIAREGSAFSLRVLPLRCHSEHSEESLRRFCLVLIRSHARGLLLVFVSCLSVVIPSVARNPSVGFCQASSRSQSSYLSLQTIISG